MAAPVNVKLSQQSIQIKGWANQAKEWEKLNQSINGNPNFYPLTIKAAYVIGVIHSLCESVQYLLSHPNAKKQTYIPAYGVFASGIELLGRCIRGNNSTSGSTKDLTTGFKWLKAKENYSSTNKSATLVTTKNASYTIEGLCALRHFSAHGQATANPNAPFTTSWQIDFKLLEKMPPHIASGLEVYWSVLQRDDLYCKNLAMANVLPLRNWPVENSWVLFSKDRFGKHHSVEEIFNRFDWKI
jgi:hypothetical protein